MAGKPDIQPYQEGDETAINEVFNEVFSDDRPLDQWAWKFRDPPVDSRPYVMLARVDGELVGQYASVAYRIKYFDRTILAIQPVDNMVREGFRGGTAGLQKRLYRANEKLWQKLEVDLAWGFPNRVAYVVGKRLLGYTDMTTIQNLFVLLGGKVAARKLRLPGFLAGVADAMARPIFRFMFARRGRPPADVRVSRADGFDARTDALCARIRDRYAVGIERDREYLAWRYSERSGRRYDVLRAERGDELVGLVVVRWQDVGDERIGFVMECLGDDEPGLDACLLASALTHLSREGADLALFRCTTADPIQEALHRVGFRLRPGMWDENVVFLICRDTVEATPLEDPANWLIRFGDAEAG